MKINLQKTAVYQLSVLLLCILLSACNSTEIEDGKVYYVSWNEGSGKVKTLIEGADADTYEKLSDSYYAIDKSHVFYQSVMLDGADPNSFKPIGEDYGKDARSVYRYAEKIPGADPASFKLLPDKPYAKDRNDYYFEAKPLQVNDMNSFRLLASENMYDYRAKDKTHYYIESKKFLLADYESFTLLRNGFALDTVNVYRLDSIVVGADPQTFKVLSDEWAKDRSACYYYGKAIAGIDVSSFEALGASYAKDKNNVYFNYWIMEGADPATIKVNTTTFVAKDRSGCYRDGQKIDCKGLWD
ncbi:MAG: hypothetical protein K0S33_2104 [Bacteroidetes bacterium]|jgi:hypothetical protein|nr:hypothetical protein [Bacteroidota bacterium]